jgi:hypothetical protein
MTAEKRGRARQRQEGYMDRNFTKTEMIKRQERYNSRRAEGWKGYRTG